MDPRSQMDLLLVAANRESFTVRMDRRSFLLQLAGASAVLGYLSPAWRSRAFASPATASLWLACGDGPREPSQGWRSAVDSGPGAALFYSLAEGRRTSIGLPFKPHIIFQHPRRKDQFACTEKWGSHLALLSLSARKARVVIEPKGRRFFGHGVFSPDGNLVYASQFDDEKHRGLIGIFRVADGERVGEFLSQGDYPHDLQLDPQGRLVISNVFHLPEGRERSGGVYTNSLQWVDPQSGNPLRRIAFDSSRPRQVAHFAQDKDGWIVAAGGVYDEDIEKNPGCILAVSPEGKMHEIKLDAAQEKALHGESVSIVIDPARPRALIASASSGAIFVWDYRENALERILVSPEPRGLVLSSAERRYYISEGHFHRLSMVEAETWRYSVAEKLRGIWGSGTHMGIFEV